MVRPVLAFAYSKEAFTNKFLSGNASTSVGRLPKIPNNKRPTPKRTAVKTLLLLSFAAALLLTPSPARSAVSLTQVAYWKFDEVRGDTFSDSVAVRDGHCAGQCPRAIRGVDRVAQQFDGAAGIEIPAQGAFAWDGYAEFSIEFWVKGEPGNTCATTDQVMVGWGSQSTGGWSLGCSAENGRARFWLGDAQGSSAVLESNRGITDGRWHHIVGIHDGLNDMNTLIVDGTDIVSVPQRFSGAFGAETAVLHIGKLGTDAHFVGSLDEVAIYQGLLPQTDILTHYYLARPYGASCTTQVNIMPLGNSITRGYGTGPDPTNPSHNYGYRFALYDSLTAASYSFEFVGGLSHGQQSGETFDFDHEGHGGLRADEIADGVGGYLAANPPEVILLHIGTNDIAQGQGSSAEDVDAILDNIDTFDEQITVILARIIDQSPTEPMVTEFNDNVEALAQARIANGDKIILVDQYSALNYASDMYDGLHPNESGYDKMATVWFDTLDDFLPTCPAAPSITSTPVTEAVVGQPYIYDVEASGAPAPTYSLGPGSPPGMEIDANTGIVSWIPTAAQVGSHSIEVEASNFVETDTQTFIINVEHRVFLPAISGSP